MLEHAYERSSGKFQEQKFGSCFFSVGSWMLDEFADAIAIIMLS